MLGLAALGVACLDLSAPIGPASISTIQLPAAFVVRGDTMRDSAGTPAPPVVNQFNAKGQLIGGDAPQFFILDSNPAAHFDPSTGVLVGDHLGTVNFIGQIRGLQTPSVPVAVTVQPTLIDQGTGAKDTIQAPLTQDTTVAPGSSPMPIVVHGAGDTTVQGVVVHYTITRTLASNNAKPAVYITHGPGGPLTTTDTTDAGGNANHDLLNVRASFLADVAIATGQKVDSVIVEASASYKGTLLNGSPVKFVFHVVGVIGSP